MGISIRAYAKRRNVHESTVRKAIRQGRITRDQDGTIDPERANLQWKANTMPSAFTADVQEGQFMKTNASAASFAQARITNEVLKAQASELKLGRLKGNLIDRKKAEAKVVMLSRQERDRWLNWPSQTAAIIAAELAVDSRQLQLLLEDQVRKQLLTQTEVRLRSD